MVQSRTADCTADCTSLNRANQPTESLAASCESQRHHQLLFHFSFKIKSVTNSFSGDTLKVCWGPNLPDQEEMSNEGEAGECE